MSGQLDDKIKRWTVKRKSALFIEIIQGKTTMAETNQCYDLAPSKIENWADDGRKSMGNALTPTRVTSGSSTRSSSTTCKRPMARRCRSSAPEKSSWCCWMRRTTKDPQRPARPLSGRDRGAGDEALRPGIGVLRRAVSFKPMKSTPKVDPRFAEAIKVLTEEVPSLGYAWSTDLARVWARKDGWTTRVLVMDCHIRELLGWYVSRGAKASTAVSALEQALIARFGSLARGDRSFLLRIDNVLCAE